MFIITTLSVLLFGYASSQDTWLETDTLFVEQINTDGTLYQRYIILL